MVFVPDLAYQLGPSMMCWMLVCNTFTYMSSIIAPVATRLIWSRNYLGPNDFPADRYNSKVCRVITSLVGGYSSFMVITIEWIILKVISQWLFGGTGKIPTWCLGMFVLGCETLGGMNSVAFTDAIQFMFMSIALLCIPILISSAYGGFFGGIFGSWNDEGGTPTQELPLMTIFAMTAGETDFTGYAEFSPGMRCEVRCSSSTPPVALRRISDPHPPLAELQLLDIPDGMVGGRRRCEGRCAWLRWL